MADNLATIAFKGLVLLFITSVVIFICFFGVLRVEQYRANNELQRRGASRYTPDGELNLWYFFVRALKIATERHSVVSRDENAR
ncbi:hypothetical protein ZHAS_00013354 [Anopheles sinensis]|uniref:Uncharacterized protein n=1 Tax=Anopheles sinensis TaxID=74873 RepID=A0A084W5C9_ANOSI|nr:hypothetical protein ZHAS_00013354 [Anopheles sinensis]